MTRRSNKNILQNSADTPIDGQKLKTVVTTEKYIEPRVDKPPVTTPQAPSLFPELDNESESDPLDRFLDNLDAEQGVRLRVDLLTEYHVTGKSGRTAPYTYCGEFPISKDALDTDQYLQIIQSMFGGGNFRLTLRGPDGRPITNFVKSIKAPTHPALALVNSNVQPVVPVTPTTTPQPLQKSLVEQLKEYSEISKHLTTIINPNGQPQAKVERPAAERPLEEKITEKLIDHVFAGNDDSLKERAIAKFLGDDKEPDFTWSQLANDIIKPLIPVVIQIAGAFLASRPVANGTASADATPNQSGDLSQQGQLPAPPPVATNTQKLLGLTRQDCLMAMPVERTAVAFDVLTTEENQAELQAIFSLTPQEILERLQIPVSLERVQWIQELQAELKGDEEEAQEVIQ